MNKGKYVFTQVVEFLPKYEFSKCVERYDGDRFVKHFSCWSQFLTMIFGQLTRRESLRETVTSLLAHEKKLYHIGIRSGVRLSTLSHANENRNWLIYHDFAAILTEYARELYASDDRILPEFAGNIYALDSTTIDLCLSVFWWAPFRKTKAAVKLHTMIDLRGSIPTFISITDGLVHDAAVLKTIEIEPGACYVMDRAYVSFSELHRMDQSLAFFVVRAKENLVYRRIYSAKKDRDGGIKCDQIIRLTVPLTKRRYPDKLRLIKYFDKEQKRRFTFLTNNFSIAATDIALLYKHRWQIELFFKWIKQHLKIKTFWGESENAVKTQIWIAICGYLAVAIARKTVKIERSLYEILQILSISAFDKTPLYQLLNEANLAKVDNIVPKQLSLWDL